MADMSDLPLLPRAITQEEVDTCQLADMVPDDQVKRILLSTAADLLDILSQPGIFGTLDKDPYMPSLETLFTRLRDGYLAPSPLKSVRINKKKVATRMGPQAPTPPILRPLADYEHLYYALLHKIQDAHGLLRVRLQNSFNSPRSPIIASARYSKGFFYDWLLQQYDALNNASLVAPLDQSIKLGRKKAMQKEIIARLAKGPLTAVDYDTFVKDLYVTSPYKGIKGLRWDIIGASPAMISGLLAEIYLTTFEVEKVMKGRDSEVTKGQEIKPPAQQGQESKTPTQQGQELKVSKKRAADDTFATNSGRRQRRKSEEIRAAKTNAERWVEEQQQYYIEEQRQYYIEEQRQYYIEEQRQYYIKEQEQMLLEAERQEELKTERLQQQYAQEQERLIFEAQRKNAIEEYARDQQLLFLEMQHQKEIELHRQLNGVAGAEAQDIVNLNTTTTTASADASSMPPAESPMPASAAEMFSTHLHESNNNDLSSMDWRARLRALGIPISRHSYAEYKDNVSANPKLQKLREAYERRPRRSKHKEEREPESKPSHNQSTDPSQAQSETVRQAPQLESKPRTPGKDTQLIYPTLSQSVYNPASSKPAGHPEKDDQVKPHVQRAERVVPVFQNYTYNMPTMEDNKYTSSGDEDLFHGGPVNGQSRVPESRGTKQRR
ncbi:unnamed protein product [Periconia digitata]|uniref:Uncharacterized protein n=1 Tax=Periconia digitata TaxID=1303443 RepID=A0A9W4UHG2_9PLEO|nr:unnamed protein product [Periconia digitata]